MGDVKHPTPANMHDVSETSKLIRKDDHVVYGDSGCFSAPIRDEIKNVKYYPR